MDHLRKCEMNNIALGLSLMANFKPALDEMISANAVELLFGKSKLIFATIDVFFTASISIDRLNDDNISLETKKEICIALKLIFKLSCVACSNAIRCNGMVSFKCITEQII